MEYANTQYMLKIEKEFQALQTSITRINQARLKNSHPLQENAEQAHREVLSKINKFIPGDSIDRRVLCNHFIDCSGCLVMLEDKKWHVLVRENIAMFDRSTSEYYHFAENNVFKKTLPRDLFMNVVAHEYGHILFDLRIAPRISIPSEMGEAFAFWFGDTVTGRKSPLDLLAFGYKQECSDFEKVIDTYDTLNRLRRRKGRNAVFDPQNLGKIVLAMGKDN